MHCQALCNWATLQIKYFLHIEFPQLFANTLEHVIQSQIVSRPILKEWQLKCCNNPVIHKGIWASRYYKNWNVDEGTTLIMSWHAMYQSKKLLLRPHLRTSEIRVFLRDKINTDTVFTTSSRFLSPKDLFSRTFVCTQLLTSHV